MSAFFYHYNRPKSAQLKRPVISVHFKGICHFVDNVEIHVPTKGRIRKTQPRFVIAGRAKNISINNGVAIITNA